MVWVCQKFLSFVDSMQIFRIFRTILLLDIFCIIYKKFNMSKFEMTKTRDKVVAHDQNVSFAEE